MMKLMQKLETGMPPALSLGYVGSAEMNYMRPSLQTALTMNDRFQRQVDTMENK